MESLSFDFFLLFNSLLLVIPEAENFKSIFSIPKHLIPMFYGLSTISCGYCFLNKNLLTNYPPHFTYSHFTGNCKALKLLRFKTTFFFYLQPSLLYFKTPNSTGSSHCSFCPLRLCFSVLAQRPELLH